MAQTKKGQKYNDIKGYSYTRDGKKVQVRTHRRSNPFTSRGAK